jgi:hypothetical protein
MRLGAAKTATEIGEIAGMIQRQMLLNEFLKEHRKVEEQEKTIVGPKSGMTALAATVKEPAAEIQKVSAQLEASKPAPRVVNNPKPRPNKRSSAYHNQPSRFIGVAAYCFAAHGSLNSPAWSCVSITLPAES